MGGQTHRHGRKGQRARIVISSKGCEGGVKYGRGRGRRCGYEARSEGRVAIKETKPDRNKGADEEIKGDEDEERDEEEGTKDDEEEEMLNGPVGSTVDDDSSCSARNHLRANSGISREFGKKRN